MHTSSLQKLIASTCITIAATMPAFAQDASRPPADMSQLVDWIKANSGQILTHDSGIEFVYANPPGDLWQLEEDRSIMRSARLVYLDETLFAYWDDGTTSKHSINAPLPVTLTDERHPMAEFWERFIGTPLTAPLGPLPAGSVFTPKGDVELPSTPNAPVKWIAFGDSLQINSASFDPQRFQWTELDQSIQSKDGSANE